jgi:hypothetical protein
LPDALGGGQTVGGDVSGGISGALGMAGMAPWAQRGRV